jgi:hypothetical protein
MTYLKGSGGTPALRKENVTRIRTLSNTIDQEKFLFDGSPEVLDELSRRLKEINNLQSNRFVAKGRQNFLDKNNTQDLLAEQNIVKSEDRVSELLSSVEGRLKVSDMKSTIASGRQQNSSPSISANPEDSSQNRVDEIKTMVGGEEFQKRKASVGVSSLNATPPAAPGIVTSQARIDEMKAIIREDYEKKRNSSIGPTNNALPSSPMTSTSTDRVDEVKALVGKDDFATRRSSFGTTISSPSSATSSVPVSGSRIDELKQIQEQGGEGSSVRNRRNLFEKKK